MNFSSFKPDTKNSVNFEAVSNKRGNLTTFSIEHKILIKNP